MRFADDPFPDQPYLDQPSLPGRPAGPAGSVWPVFPHLGLAALRARVRRPLAWLVMAELAVTVSFGVVAWHIWQGHRAGFVAGAASAPGTRRAQPPASVSTRAPSPAGRTRVPGGALPFPGAKPGVSPAAAGPGLGVDPAFLEGMFGALNRDSAAWERAEWNVLTTVGDAVRKYVERVVVPAVERSRTRAGP